MKRNLGLLLIGALAFFVVVVYPAHWLGCTNAKLYGAVAAGLCLVPAMAIAAWAGWSPRRTPEQRLLLVLGGTFVRMGFVLGVGLVLYVLEPLFRETAFWIWVTVFYLFTLALEVGVLLTGQAAENARMIE